MDQPVTAALNETPYQGERVLDALRSRFADTPARLKVVDDAGLLARVGSRKALNTVLLASALGLGRLPLDLDDLREAVRVCVKPQFVELNLRAIDIAAGE